MTCPVVGPWSSGQSLAKPTLQDFGRELLVRAAFGRRQFAPAVWRVDPLRVGFLATGEDAFGSARRQIPVHRQDHLLPMHGIAVTGAHNLECEFLGLSLLSTAEDPVPLAPAYLVAAGSEQRQPTILVARTRPPKPAR